ncbi:MAG: replication initiator protein A [Candidatus Atribacteria bacterium]|nr:replication initiator protein A [Candidatus Atribacteria bacterium]
MEKFQEITIKNNKDKIILPEIIKSEVNLLKLPFFALERKDKRLKTKYREIDKQGDVEKEKIWSVLANSEYGYPGPFDRGVHKAIEQIISEILREKGEIENPIPFSIYDLCNRMGIATGGKNYHRVKEALEKIQMTGIKSENAFYHKGKKKWISSVFSLYDSVIFRGKQLEDGSITEINLLFLSDIYLQSLNSRYIKPIDYTYWRSLKSKIASRLYEILGVKFYGIRNKKGCDITYRYSTLCQLLPLTPYRYISDAKRQLNFGNDELKDTGFISKYEWSENGNKDWLISYWPGERAKEEIRRAKIKSINNRTEEYLPEPKEEVIKYTEEQINLINELVKINVSKITAEKLVKSNDQELIEKWIEAVIYSNADNKAAYLVKAIRENWQFPEEYLRFKKEQLQEKEEEKIEYIKMKNKKEEDKKRQEEIKKYEKIFNSLNSSQQEEIKKEAKNRLPDFWKEKLNKLKIKGNSSKLLEVVMEEKKREIIKEWIKDKKISF